MNPGRIVVTLEAHPKAKSAVDTAARLAARLQAELVALVVEDIQLLHFAALPFAREVGRVSAHNRELDVATLERSFRSVVSDAERWLTAARELERDALAALHSAGRRSINHLLRAADRAELQALLGDAR